MDIVRQRMDNLEEYTEEMLSTTFREIGDRIGLHVEQLKRLAAQSSAQKPSGPENTTSAGDELKDCSPADDELSRLQSYELEDKGWPFIVKLQIRQFEEWAKTSLLFNDSEDSLDKRFQNHDWISIAVGQSKDRVAYNIRCHLRRIHRYFGNGE